MSIMDLKKNAPKGEFLAYINKEEAAMLKKAGGSGELVNGIPSFRPQDYGQEAASKKAGFDQSDRSNPYSNASQQANKDLNDRVAANQAQRQRDAIKEAEYRRSIVEKLKAKKKKKASLPFWKGAAYGLTTNKKKVAALRKQYKDYLKSKGVNNIPTTLDDEDLYSFYESDAFNYTPTVPAYDVESPEEYADPNTLNYGDWMSEYQGSPGIKHSGNLGEVGEKYVKTRNSDGSPKTYGYHEKRGGDGPIYYPGYTPNGMPTTTSSSTGGEEVDETKRYTYRMTDGNSEVPYALYGEEDYPESVQFQSYLASGGRARRANGGIMGTRARKAFGGIMDRVTGRKAYGLGSIFKSVKKAVGKVLKSPIGKAAVLYAGGTYLAGGLGTASWKPGWSTFGSNLMSPFGKNGIATLGKSLFKPLSDSPSFMEKAKKFVPWAVLGYGLSQTKLGEAKPNETSFADRGGQLIDRISGNPNDMAGMRENIELAKLEAGDDPEKLAAIDAKYNNMLNLAYHANLPGSKPYENYRFYNAANGGRIGKAEGGLMNLGGMEKDYRAEGGFVPIGKEEKADDVPARLSVNEFVFTADAVRNAGGGDIDQGAEVMENVMKNLEAGGKISAETQGNTGAQEMFSVSERLGEVI